jgi:PAS domain S-box-containing protein
MITRRPSPEIQILLLEDVPADADLVRQAIQNARIPARIRLVDRKDEYVNALEALRPDIILADHALPSFRSAEALKLARRVYPDVPFIFVSGAVGEELAVEAVREGATDYVLKDHLIRLGPAVRRALEEASHRREKARTEEALRLIVANALDAVIMMDSSGIVSAWNPQSERIFGWRSDEAVGRLLADLIIPERLRAAHRVGLERYLAVGEGPILARRVEFPAVHRDGHEFDVELTVTPILQEEGPCFSAFIRDLGGARRQAARVAVEHAVAKILAEAVQADTALASVLEAIGRGLEWDLSCYWKVDRAAQALVYENSWSREPAGTTEFIETCCRLTLSRGICLPGRAWESGDPVWSGDVSADDTPARSALVKAAGFQCAYAFPILEGDEVVGVIEGFARRKSPADPDLLDALDAMGRQIGQFLRRQRGEEAVRATASQLRLIADALPSRVSYVDREWRYAFANRAYEDWFGCASGDLVGKHIWEVLGTAAFEVLRPYAERAFRGERVEYEALFPFKTGGARWMQTNYVPDVRPDGTIAGFFVLSTDISARKRAEDATRFLSEAAKLLSSSLDTETTLSNLAHLAVPRIADWCTIFLRTEEGIRPLVFAHKDPAKVREVEELMEQFPPSPDRNFGNANVLRTGKSEFYPVVTDELLAAAARSPEHLRKLRALGLKSGMTVPMMVGGTAVAVLTLAFSESGRQYTAEDLSFAEELARRAALAVENAQLYEDVKRESAERQRALEELRDLNEHLEHRVRERTGKLEDITRELDAFAATVAHDLRAPLRIMKGFSEMLIEDYAGKVLDPVGQEFARKIDHASERMTKLVDDLLSYSRLARQDVPIHSVDLEQSVDQVLRDMADEFREARAEVVVQRPLGRVLGHGGLLAQVLGNLLSNALKFVEPGIDPRIVLRTTEDRGGSIRLWIEDNGIGVAPEHQDRIFGVFERLHTPDRYPGTGLGLAIVRRALGRMDGEVGVDSLPGTGSRFWIRLRSAAPAAAP